MSESLTFNVCMKRKLFTNLNPQKNLEKLIIFTTQWCLQIYFKEKTDEQRTGRNLSQTTWVIKNVFWSTQPTAKEVSSCQGWWQLITRPRLLPISWVSLPSPCLIILEVIRNETQNSITIHSFSHKHFQRAFLLGKTDQKLSLLRNTNLKKNNFKGIFLKAVILTIKEFIKSQRNVVILHRKIQERKLCLRWTFSGNEGWKREGPFQGKDVHKGTEFWNSYSIPECWNFGKSYQICLPGVRCIWEHSMKNVCVNTEFVLCPDRNPSKTMWNYKPCENKVHEVLEKTHPNRVVEYSTGLRWDWGQQN